MKQDVFGKVRARKAALRHKHPSRSLNLIVVAGDYGVRTTALYLGELLAECGTTTAVFTDDVSHIAGTPYDHAYDVSADAVQRALSKAKKQADTVVLGITPALLRTHALETLRCTMTILTSDGEAAETVSRLPIRQAVVASTIDTTALQLSPHQVITYGEDATAEASIKHVTLYRKGTEVDVTIDHQTNLKLSTHLLGIANAHCVAAAAAAGYLLGLNLHQFEEGIARLEAVTGNFDPLHTKAPVTAYVDSAPSDRSVVLAHQSARQLAKRRLLVACDGTISPDSIDMLESEVDRLTVVGGHDAPHRYGADSLESAIHTTLRAAKKDDTVLLLGVDFARIESTGDGQPSTHAQLIIDEHDTPQADQSETA